MNRLVILLVVAIPMYLISNLIEINIDGGMDFSSIQEAIDNSISGDTLLVHPGIYQENINYGGRDISVISLYYVTGDSSYIENTIIGDVEDGCVVTFENCETSSAILGGLSIREGWGASYPDYRAGGISCLNFSSPTLKDLDIYGNNYGASGGIYCEYSDPLIMNCHVHDNRGYVAIYGGGVTLYQSDAHIINCLIEDNYTSIYGGGICVFSLSDPVIENTVIRGNHAESGGGIYAQACNLTLNNVLIEENDADEGGGITLYHFVNPSFMDVTCCNNEASTGGGIYLHGVDCEISGINLISNQSNAGGGLSIFESIVNVSDIEVCGNLGENVAGAAYIAFFSQINFENVTFSNNSSGYESIRLLGTSSLNLYNCIMADEETSINFVNWYGINNTLEVNYCNFTGGEESLDCDNNGTYVWGEGNISVDPGFACPEMDDWRLMYYSECIDAGDPESEYDPDGTICDLGANFYDQVNCVYPVIDIPEYLHFESGEIVEMDFAQYVYDVNPDELVLTVAGNTNVTIEINDLDVVFSCTENWAGIEELTFSINDNSGRLISSDIIIVDVTKDLINVPEDFTEIQTAIQQANADSTTIIVAPGEYHENLDFLGKNISLVSYFESTGDTTYINETIIDGDSLGTVINILNCEQAEVIGFTITGGYGASQLCGGIEIDSCQYVSLINLKLIDNDGKYAGIKSRNSTTDLNNIIIEYNYGTGISVEEINMASISNLCIRNNNEHYCSNLSGSTSHPIEINSVEYSNNYNNGYESACGLEIYSTSGSVISDLMIKNNCSSSGYILSFPRIEDTNISNVIVRNNNAFSASGFTILNSRNVYVENLICESNHTENWGGGMMICDCDFSDPVIINNALIANNESDNNASAIYISNCYLFIVNSTIVNNISSQDASIYIRSDSEEEPYIINSIIYDNIPAQIQIGNPSSRSRILHVDHCNVEGGEEGVIQGENSILYWHEGNIELPPEFMGEDPYPFSLSETSPCVDTGTMEFPIDFELPLTDLAGNERIWGDGIDMGCYEFGAPPYSGNTEYEIEIVKCKIKNYPNPFNPQTTISFELEEGSDAELSIYNVKGQQIREWKIKNAKCKMNKIVWDGKDDTGQRTASGVYFYRLVSGNKEFSGKMIMLK